MPRRTSGRFSSARNARGHKSRSSMFKSTQELAYVKQRMTTRTLQGMTAVHDMGLPPTLINAILNGDLKAAQKLGAMGDQGRNVIKLMPEIVKNTLDFIEGTRVYNDGMFQIYTEGMKADVEIKQKSRELGSANLQHTLDLQYNREKWVYDNQAIRQSAQHARELLQVNAYLLEFNKNVDHKGALDSAANATRKRMLDARLQYNINSLQHMLRYGDNADLSLVTEKDYSGFAEAIGTPNAIGGKPRGLLGFGQTLLATVQNGIRALLPNI